MEYKIFGEKLRWLRANKGLSQRQVAKGLEISVPGYCKIERGLSDINLNRLHQIAAYFGVNVVSLLLEDEPGPYFENEKLKGVEAALRESEMKVMALQAKLLGFFEDIK